MNRYFLTHRKIDVALLIGAVAVAPLVYGGVWLAQDARLPSEAAMALGAVFVSGLVWAALAVARVGGITPRRGARIALDLDAPDDLDVVAATGVSRAMGGASPAVFNICSRWKSVSGRVGASGSDMVSGPPRFFGAAFRSNSSISSADTKNCCPPSSRRNPGKFLCSSRNAASTASMTR